MKKRIGIVTAMVVCVFISQAQEKGRVEWGIRGGVNFQNVNGKDVSGNQLKNDMITAYHAGLTAAFPIVQDFYIQSGVLYSVKGTKSDQDFSGLPLKGTVRISYVEIPFSLLYKPMLGKGHLVMGFGPYVAWGVGGTIKNITGPLNQNLDLEFKNTVRVTDPVTAVYYRSFDAGGNLLFGYEMRNKVSVQLNAQMGFIKINPEYESKVNDRSSFKNTGFGLSVGYRL